MTRVESLYNDISVYRRADGDLMLLLEFFLLEKCLHEIAFELTHRPDWIDIPLRGLAGLLSLSR